MRDLGALIVGLMTAATGGGDRQVRTFTIPPELAELAAAHQELKAEQQALTARFAARQPQERAALRASLAALTERATRDVSAAAAAVAPGETSHRANQRKAPPAGGVGSTDGEVF